MIHAKQINILSETEVPFEVGAGYGSNYNIDLHTSLIYADSSNGLHDIKEQFEDDNYIVGAAKNGETYTKSGETHKFARNNFVTNQIGNMYTGEYSSFDYGESTNAMPGYYPVSFKKDMLALQWNDRSPSLDEYQARYTGNAYCIKSISAVATAQPSRPGYFDITWYMYAKEIADSEYQYQEMCHHYSLSEDSVGAWAFVPTSHTLFSTDGTAILDEHINEAHSVILSQSNLLTWVRLLFTYIGETGATSTKIMNYIEENIPYGAVLASPSRNFALRWKGGDVWQLHDVDYISNVLNPIKTYYHNLPPHSNIGKSWIIPFDSEDEFNAACCTKTVFDFRIPYKN